MKIENLCFRAVCCASDGTGVRSGVAPDTGCPCSTADVNTAWQPAAITSAITATATARIAMLRRIVSIHTRDPAPSLQTYV
jgi:hypothetical protein